MTQRTLLTHIAPRLATGEENLATESLCFVLSQSVAARTAFIGLLSHILDQQLPALTFQTQAADADGTIPDIVGLDALGKPVAFVEAGTAGRGAFKLVIRFR